MPLTIYISGNPLTYEEATALGYTVEGTHIEWNDNDQQIFYQNVQTEGMFTCYLKQNGVTIDTFPWKAFPYGLVEEGGGDEEVALPEQPH